MFPQLFHRALLVCVLLACSVFTRAQFTTLVRISDPGLIPVVDTTYRFTDGVDGVRLVSEDPRLNEILQSFTFYDFAMLDSLSSNPAVRQYFVFRFYSTGNRNRFRREIEAHFGNSFTEWSEIWKTQYYDFEHALNNKRIKIVAAHSDEIYALSFNLDDCIFYLQDRKGNRIYESNIDVEVYSNGRPKLDSVMKTFNIRALIPLKPDLRIGDLFVAKYYVQFATKEDMCRFAEVMPKLLPGKFSDMAEFTKDDWARNDLMLMPKVRICVVEYIQFDCEATFIDEFGQPIPKLHVQLMGRKDVQSTTNRKGNAALSAVVYNAYREHDYPYYLIVSDANRGLDTIYVKCKISRCSIQEEPGVYYDSREFSSKFVYTMYPTSQNKWKKRKISEQYDDDSYSYYDSELNHHPYFEYKVSSEAIRQYFRANRKQSVGGTKLDWRYGDFSEFSFLINKKGEIVKESITLISGGDIQSPKNQELIRLLTSMPRWTPAVRNGKRVECRCEMYIDHLLSRTSNLRLKFFYP
ncbi:MAG: hypothetical protein MJZ98_07715 [Paludibacteraceae bacterium]|nr:hypothetical protein [Paludibacteraceae bacterium]